MEPLRYPAYPAVKMVCRETDRPGRCATELTAGYIARAMPATQGVR